MFSSVDALTYTLYNFLILLGLIHLSLTDGLSVKCVIYKTFLFFIRIFKKKLIDVQCVQQLHQVSLNSKEKQKKGQMNWTIGLCRVMTHHKM